MIRRSASAETAFTPAATFAMVGSSKEVLGYVIKNEAGQYFQQGYSDDDWGGWRDALRCSEEHEAKSVADAYQARVVRVVRRR